MAGTMEILNTIGQMIINDMEENATNTIFTFEEVTSVLSKEHGSRVEGHEFQSRHGSIRLPERLEMLDLDASSCVQTQVYTCS